MPQPFLGPSLQSFPLAGIAHLSRGHIAPLPLSTDVLEHAPRGLIATGFADARALTRACLVSPGDFGLPFRAPESALPGRPGPRSTKPLRSVCFLDSEALFLLRVRSRQPKLPRTDGRYSPGLLPL